MHLIGVHLIGVLLIGVHLIGMHFIGVHLMGVPYRHIPYGYTPYRRASYRRAFYRRASYRYALYRHVSLIRSCLHLSKLPTPKRPALQYKEQLNEIFDGTAADGIFTLITRTGTAATVSYKLQANKTVASWWSCAGRNKTDVEPNRA
jgi:hypothetical protein